MPLGMEDTSKYPNLFALLIDQGWNDEDLGKLASGNLIRVLKQVEKVRDAHKYQVPDSTWINEEDIEDKQCHTPE